jgi:pimeloyl-ACP methyl ester carboxylesterase
LKKEDQPVSIDLTLGNRPVTGRSSRRRFVAGATAALGASAVLSPGTRAQDATPASAAGAPVATPPVDEASFDAAFSHHTAMVDGVRLHYVVGGQGDPVVLLHGWPQTWYEWRRAMPALAERHTVIAPDLRGLGDSAKPLSGYDARTVAADVHGLVRQLGHSRIFLAGHDIGGWVAMAYAAAHRDEVRRLAILETFPADESILPFTALNPEQSLWHVGFHFQRDLPEALIAGRERLYLSHFYRGAAYNPAAIDEAAIDEYVRCYAAEGGLRAGFEYYRALFTNIEQTKEDFRTKLEMPFLALGGEFSFGPFLEQEWPKYATNVQAEVVPQAGHWIPEEQPEFLGERLLTFFDEG